MVPKSLRNWFVIHFIVDMFGALPLILFPSATLQLVGWEVSETFGFRLFGAALMGIGLESLLGRNASIDTFRGMLRMKLIWSSSAILGMSIALLEGEAPGIMWGLVIIFVFFFILWLYYAMSLRGNADSEEIPG